VSDVIVAKGTGISGSFPEKLLTGKVAKKSREGREERRFSTEDVEVRKLRGMHWRGGTSVQLRDCKERITLCRPSGTRIVFRTHPALKRWA